MYDAVREVMKLLLEMSVEEVAAVRAYIQSRLLTGERRSEVFIREMNGILGADIRERSRRHPLVWGRFIVIGELLEGGWSTTLVGNVFGMDHSSVVYAKRQVETMLEYPGQYAAEIELYKEFKRRIYR